MRKTRGLFNHRSNIMQLKAVVERLKQFYTNRFYEKCNVIREEDIG
jgi:hypothetical protein